MSVVGIDFGTLHSKIGVARHRGIDIITNEVSNRATPSLVAFGPKQRAIGEPAKTQETSNFKNTIGSLKRLIGRTISDPEIDSVEKAFLNAKLVDVNGTVGVEANYLGQPKQFSFTQLVAAYFSKLRDIASNELKNTVTDVVIAIPAWYTEVQRRAIIDAASIASLRVVRLINDSTAAALGYGITKSDLPEVSEEVRPRNIAFVDVGHSSMTCSIVSFVKGHLTVKSTACDPHIGGRSIDQALVRHFAAVFKDKYKIDVLSSPKATFRLAQGCEKLKKVLSANAEAPLNVESLMNDVDASSKLSREELEQLIAPILDRVPSVLDRAIAEASIPLEEIDAVELIGGSTRIPAVRTRVQAAFKGKSLSTTLNSDEAVARGATFACAMFSPIFRVREFTVTDLNQYPIKIQWQRAMGDTDEDDTELEVFSKGNNMPSTKVLSFFRKDPFELEVVYSNPSTLLGGVNPWIGRFTAKSIPPPPEGKEGDLTCVRVRVKLNQNGVVNFEGAYVEETVLVDEESMMDVDGNAEGAPEKKKKKKSIKKEVPFLSYGTGLEQSLVDALKETEGEMEAADKLVADTEDRKNALEEYVYDTRSKLDDRYAAFVTSEDKSKLLSALQEAEDWLYTEEGEDATKSAYVERLSGLHSLGGPIFTRWKETEDRPRYISALRETLNTYMSQATSGDEKYAHIPSADLEKVVERCAEVSKWLEDLIVKQAEREKWKDAVLKCADVEKKRDEVVYFVTPILSKPKPKIPPSGGASGTQTPREKDQEEGPSKTEGGDKGPSEMDVD